MRKITLILVVIIALCCVQTGLGAIHDISVGDSFAPTATLVYPGDTVRWTLVSGTHTVVSDQSSPKPFVSSQLGTAGETFEVVFGYADGPGPFPYHCADHPAVVDTIFTSDICMASFDVNGDGFPMTIGDLVYLIRLSNDILNGVVPPPDNLYQADITGDCVVDAADIELLNNIFIYGITFVPWWPVPTCCYPSLDVGACCLGDSCSIRSAANCLAIGGTYSGSGTACEPNPCSCCVLRGDANHDGLVDVGDLICIVESVFCAGAPCCEIVCADEVDINSDGAFDIADLVSLVEYMFVPGAAAPAPCTLK